MTIEKGLEMLSSNATELQGSRQFVGFRVEIEHVVEIRLRSMRSYDQAEGSPGIVPPGMAS